MSRVQYLDSLLSSVYYTIAYSLRLYARQLLFRNPLITDSPVSITCTVQQE
jgi:hypothetical protein